MADVVAMAPRRIAKLAADLAALGLSIGNIVPIGCALVSSPAAPVTLGGGTEDWPILLATASTPLVIDAAGPTIEFHREGVNAGPTLMGHALVYGYAALGVSRRPEGIGQVRGLTTPTFT